METTDIKVIEFNDHVYFDLMKYVEAQIVKAFAIPSYLISEEYMETIVTCDAIHCSWNRFEHKVHSCSKLMIKLDQTGKCEELSKYKIGKDKE